MTIHALRKVRGKARTDWHEQNRLSLDRSMAEDVAWLDSDRHSTTRESWGLECLPDLETANLDNLLNAVGGARVLAALVRLMDSRVGGDGDPMETFDDALDGEVWRERADIVERAACSLARSERNKP